MLALPFSILRSSSTSEGRLRAAQAARDPRAGHGHELEAPCAVLEPALASSARTARRTPTPATRTRWEVTRAQPGKTGILVDYTGGTIGASFGSGTPESRAQQFLAQLEPVLPGTKAWNGKATIDFWPGYRWTKGSYSYWKVGQYQRFAGIEGGRQGNCHFAGEHTSIDFQGYLNGAVETGQRAAAEILADFK